MKPLLLDQGIPRSAAKELRESGVDAVHVGELGLSRATDAEILDYARKENRLVVTLDADFHTLLAMSRVNRPSVIRIRIEGLSGKELADLLLTSDSHMSHALDEGAAISITEQKIRIHRLPILENQP